MTDTSQENVRPSRHSPERQANVQRRFKAEARFKYAGLACVLAAVGFLVLLLSTVVGNGLPAFRINTLSLPIDLSAKNVDPQNMAGAKYRSLVNKSLALKLPFVSGRKDKKLMRGLVSSGASVIVKERLLANPSLLGETRNLLVPVSDTADLYFKGLLAKISRKAGNGTISLSGLTGDVEIEAEAPIFNPYITMARAKLGENSRHLTQRATALQRSIDKLKMASVDAKSILENSEISGPVKARAQQKIDTIPEKIASIEAEQAKLKSKANALLLRANAAFGSENLTRDDASLLLEINGGIVKITSAEDRKARGEILVPPSSLIAEGPWKIAVVSTPESERKITDKEVAWLEHLQQAGLVTNGWNTNFFTRGASREAEMAGIWGAALGSMLTMLVTLALSFPLGIASAIYLEEFAPKNRLTDFIEVNINNLAAVPSIVFGLLGLGIFINGVSLGWFTLGGGFPRSAAITGGTVLALMTLPTIIIASRAALRAVPPSIREAALGVGASKVQTVFHRVLPLAMPGMLTGTIIGMAQALGETAPLLMIGMVAFIVDIPGGLTDPATVLPVQIYMWADFPEIAFQQKTAAAIMILLGFLVLMNLVAVLLRKRFERRW